MSEFDPLTLAVEQRNSIFNKEDQAQLGNGLIAEQAAIDCKEILHAKAVRKHAQQIYDKIRQFCFGVLIDRAEQCFGQGQLVRGKRVHQVG